MADARVIPIKAKDPKERAKKKAAAKRPTAKRPPASSGVRGSRGSAATAAAHDEEPEAAADHAPLPGAEPAPVAWDRKVAEFLAFLRRRVTGDYEVDEFGYDRELTDRVLNAPLRPLYSKWFRVETRGLENIPDTGGALIVANHSGTVAIDSLMTSIALLDHHPARRQLRMLGANLVFQTPVVGEYARKSGSTLACAPDAERLLNKGELVGVWPEGFKGVGKPFSERYKLQRFGRGGFVSAALRTKSPIIPCAIVGAEEIYPMISNAKTLARIMGVPYFPITPTFPWLG
ncbi:MAG: lysophospholipid acyltransferase family protein, partial [Candidatus Nanopelagicales bacterium]